MSTVKAMTKVERVKAALAGEPVDRTPISFWYHFGLQDQPPAVFADAELAFYHKYDVDWLKIMHDFPFGSAELLGSVKSPSDWRKLRPIGPRAGGFAQQAEALTRIGEGLTPKGGSPEAMYIDTIFNPWATAQKLCGKAGVSLLKQDRAAFRDGLKVIAESLAGYVGALHETGASGVYLAVDGATPDWMSAAEYVDLVRPFDLQILEAAKNAPFNVLHVHGASVYFNELMDYPAHGISWSEGISRPTISEARSIYSGCIISGIDEVNVVPNGTIADIQAQVRSTIRDAGGKRVIVACGCAVPTDTAEAKLKAARAAVEG